MKQQIKYMLGMSLLLPLFVMTPVIAQGNSNRAQVAQNEASPTTEADAEEEAVDPAQLKARLEERKTALKTKLTTAQQNRIKARCKGAQGVLSSLNGRIKGIETSRDQVHDNLISHLESLSTKLKTAGVNTDELNNQIAELKTRVETFNTDLAAYKQTVTDLTAMDCAADPTAYQASLEAARTARAKVATSSLGIRTYAKETIKTTLQTLKTQLETTSGEAE